MGSYLKVLKVPGALQFCLSGLLARFGSAMVGIGIVLMVSGLYGAYDLAGNLTAANAVAWATGTAILSNLVDRYGQRRIMLPAALFSAASLAVMAVVAVLQAPVILLYLFSILSGFTNGSPGAMVRARWSFALSSPDDLHTAYSLEAILDEICFAVGPLLATWAATSVHPVGGLVGPILFMAGGGLIFYSLTATQPEVFKTTNATKERSRFMLTYPGVASILAVGLMFGCIFGCIDITTVAAATDWGARSMSGLILALMSIGSAIGGFVYGSRTWTSPLWKRFAVLVGFLGAGVCSFFFAHNLVILGICGFVTGSMVAPSMINANGLIGHLVPKLRLTEGLAWLGTSIGIGVSIGAWISGHAIHQYGYRGGFYCIAACGLIACVVGLASAPILKTRFELERRNDNTED